MRSQHSVVLTASENTHVSYFEAKIQQWAVTELHSIFKAEKKTQF